MTVILHTNMVALETFFLVGNQKKLFHNFNTATHGGLKNIIFEIFF
jgi:hypothetical protein